MIIPNGECCHRFMNRLFMWSPKFIHNGKNLVIFDITLDILKESLNLGEDIISLQKNLDRKDTLFLGYTCRNH